MHMTLLAWYVVTSIQAVAHAKTSVVTTELQVIKCGVPYLNMYVPTTYTCTSVVDIVDGNAVGRRWYRCAHALDTTGYALVIQHTRPLSPALAIHQ